MVFFHLEEARAQHRGQGHGDEPGHQDSGYDHYCERLEEAADDAAHEDYRHEDGDQRQCRRQYREHDLGGAVDRRAARIRVELFAVAEDVLQHHDGVVDHDPDEQQQRQQGHGIQGVSHEIDQRDRPQQGDGDRGGDDQRRADAFQKGPDHEGCEQGAQDQVFLQGGDHLAHEQRVVGGDGQLQPGWQLGLDFGLDAVADLVDDRHGVGVGNLDDAQADRLLAVEFRRAAAVFEAIHHLGDIAQLQGGVIAVGHHQLLQVAHPVVFEIELDQVFPPPGGEEAAGHHEVLVAQCLQHFGRGHVEGRHAVGIQFDPHRAFASAADAYLADPVDGFQGFLDGIDGVGVELLEGAVPLQGEPHDRLGAELDLGNHRRIGLVGQLAQHLIDLGLNLVESDVDGFVEVEGDHHIGSAGRRGRLDVFDASDAIDRVFDDVGHRGVDDLG